MYGLKYCEFGILAKVGRYRIGYIAANLKLTDIKQPARVRTGCFMSAG